MNLRNESEKKGQKDDESNSTNDIEEERRKVEYEEKRKLEERREWEKEKEKKKLNVEEWKESFVSVSPEMMYAFAFALWKLSYNGIMADSEKIIIKVEPMPQIDWFVDLPKN